MGKLKFDSHYKDLFEKTSDLIHFASITGTIETANTSWLKTLGYTLEEVEGRPIYDFIAPESKKLYKSSREHMIEHNFIDQQMEFAFLRKDGNTVLVEGEIAGVYLKGEYAYTRGVFRNITSRRILEKEKEELYRRLTAFFDYAPDAVIVINKNQLILEWNKKAETIFGFNKEDVTGKPLSEAIIPVRYREAHQAGMAHFLKTGEGPVLNKTIEVMALHKSNHEFPINLSVSNVMLDEESLFIAFISDITDKKAIEEKTTRQETELNQSKLLNERKNDFLSIASHELKTPLTIIKSFSQLALMVGEKKSDPLILGYLQKINQQTTKITHLVNELLDVSRIQSGRMVLTKVLTDSEVFMKDAISTLEHVVQSHKVVLTHCVSTPVCLDIFHIEQVLTNLITNAAKYSPGKSTIEVACKMQDQSLIVSIKDFGLGISQKNQSKLFGKFYRVDEIMNDFSGFGIGLYISSEIIKQHNGDIWVESEQDLGSTFSFSLPLDSLPN